MKSKYILIRYVSSLILAVVLITGCFSNTTLSAYEVDYTNEINYGKLLTDLGIFENVCDYDMDADREVKRWEFIVLCHNLIKSFLSDNYENVFSDVPEKAFYAPYVYDAYKNGMISLNGARTFNPEREITLEQAVKIIVNIIGFEPQALSIADYPTGYLSIAHKYKILNGIAIPASGKLTFRLTARLFYNLFDAPFAYPSRVIESNGSYDLNYEYGEHTVYSYYRNLYKDSGIVTATVNGTSGAFSQDLDEGRVAINDNVFYSVNSYDNLMGKSVKYFYLKNNDNDEKEIIYAQADKSNRELIIEREDIISLTADNILQYEDSNGYRKEKKINSGVNVVYNNRYAMKILNYPRKKISEADEIRLLDNNGDNEWDFVFIEKSDIYFVDAVAPESKYFSSLYNSDYISLSEIEDGESTPLIKNGQQISFNNIKKYNVAQVKKSYDGSKINEIEIVANEISGKIKSVTNDGKNVYILVDDTEYKVNNVFLNSDKYNIEIGEEVTFALTKNNEIVGFKRKNEDKGYGYIIDMRVATVGIDYRLRVKMLNFEGDLVNYEFADKFYIDSVRYSDNTKEILDNIIFSIKETGTDSNYIGGIYEYETSLIPDTISLKKGIHQLVIYNLDEDGKINKFDTVKPDTNGKLSRDFMPKFNTAGTPSTRYLSAGYIISDLNSNSRFIMSADTLVFSVPVNGKDDPDNYMIGDRTLLPGLEYHTVHAYNVDPETMIAEVVIAEKGDAKNSGLQPEEGIGKRREFISITLDSTKYSVVTKVTQSLDLNGNPAMKVYVLNKKLEDYFFVSNDTFVYDYKEYKEKDEKDVSSLDSASIKPGQVVVNTVVPASKYAKTVCILGTPLQDINAQDATYIVGASGYDECIFGRLVSKKNATIQVEILKEGNWITYGYNVGSSAEVYRCTVGGKVEPFDLNAINYELNRYVFIRSRVGKIPIIVVYDY